MITIVDMLTLSFMHEIVLLLVLFYIRNDKEDKMIDRKLYGESE